MIPHKLTETQLLELVLIDLCRVHYILRILIFRIIESYPCIHLWTVEFKHLPLYTRQ